MQGSEAYFVVLDDTGGGGKRITISIALPRISGIVKDIFVVAFHFGYNKATLGNFFIRWPSYSPRTFFQFQDQLW